MDKSHRKLAWAELKRSNPKWVTQKSSIPSKVSNNLSTIVFRMDNNLNKNTQVTQNIKSQDL